MVDDLRPELGIYDHPVVKTPHIDKFSKNATIFTNAYVNVPVCGASRASMMTGMSQRIRRTFNVAAVVIASSPYAAAAPTTRLHVSTSLTADLATA